MATKLISSVEMELKDENRKRVKALQAERDAAVEELDKVKAELLSIKKLAKTVIRECSRSGSYTEKVQALDDATDW